MRPPRALIPLILSTSAALAATAAPPPVSVVAGQSLAEALDLPGDGWVVAIDGGLVRPLDTVAELPLGTHQLMVARRVDGQLQQPRWLAVESAAAGAAPVTGRLLLDRSIPRAEFQIDGPQSRRAGRLVLGPSSRIQVVLDDATQIADRRILLDGVPVAQTSLSDFPAGSHQLLVEATDSVGNTGPAGQLDFVVDATAPTLDSDVSAVNGNGPLFGPPVTVSLAVADDYSDTLTLEIKRSGRWQIWPLDQPIVTEQSQLTVRVSDEFGNSDEQLVTWRYDEQGPSIALLPATQEQVTGRHEITLTQGQSVRFDIADDAGVAKAEYRYNNKPWLPVPEHLRFRDAGVYRIDVRATDQIGNRSQLSWVVRAEPADRRQRGAL